MNVNALSYFLPTNSTANNANSTSSVQQQADVLGLSPNDQFLAQLQQVQSPQQFQAMISQMTGQPQQADTPATSGTPTAATPTSSHHCSGGHHASKSSQSSAADAFQAASTTDSQNQSLLASIFGSANPSQSVAL